jgi:hypothetical protein
MEDRDMKKEYMQPAMQVVNMNVNVQMLAGSVTSVVTNLDPSEAITPSSESINSWDDAMGHEFDMEDDWDWSE